jgi:hypothetical protein
MILLYINSQYYSRQARDILNEDFTRNDPVFLLFTSGVILIVPDRHEMI